MVLDVWKEIKKKQFTPLYLMYGSEPYLINETIQKIKESALTDDEIEFNIANFDMEETPIQFALEEAETFPFIGERKLIIVHNPIFLTAEKAKVDHDVALLLEYIENPSPFSIVVFAGDYEKLDERKKITKQLKRKAKVVEVKKLKDQELMNWIATQARALGVSIEQVAVQDLLTISGQNLMLLTSELQKMSLYVGAGGTITSQIVSDLASKSLEQTIFTLIDFIMTRQTAQAIQLLQQLLKQKEEPIKILALMASQIRTMYTAKSLAKEGYSQQQIASLLKIHPFRVKLALEKARSFQEKELMVILHNMADADYKMKTGQMDKVLLLEMVILQSANKVKL